MRSNDIANSNNNITTDFVCNLIIMLSLVKGKLIFLYHLVERYSWCIMSKKSTSLLCPNDETNP